MSSSTDSPSEILINIKGPNELKIQVNITTDKTVMDLKRAIAEKSDVEADRQRLIYSALIPELISYKQTGKVLKDEDVLSQYKIQTSHTIHMVKGAARNNASTSSSTPQVLPAMQAGQNPSDPLTLLNGPMGHGLMAGFNPFTGLDVNPNDPNMMQGMLESPQFLQQMSSLMSNPAILDQVIASNPQLQEMGPQIRQIFQSEQFRQILSNPESMRTMLQMSAMLGLGGGGGGGGGGSAPRGPGLFGAAAAAQQVNNTGSPATATPFNPSAWPPFPPAAGQAGNAGTTGQQGSTPGMFDPALLQQLLGGAGGGFPGLGGFGAPAAAAPADSRPPEERFQIQLGQLQDMGFSNASRNIRALLATGGNVHSAVEYILNGGGL